MQLSFVLLAQPPLPSPHPHPHATPPPANTHPLVKCSAGYLEEVRCLVLLLCKVQVDHLNTLHTQLLNVPGHIDTCWLVLVGVCHGGRGSDGVHVKGRDGGSIGWSVGQQTVVLQTS